MSGTLTRLALLLGALLGLHVLVLAGEDKPSPQEQASGKAESVGAGERLQLALDPGGHTAEINDLMFSPDSKSLITVAYDKTIRVWDLATGQSPRVLRPPCTPGPEGKLSSAALSPDGTILAVCAESVRNKKPVGLIYLIRLSDGRIEHTLEGNLDLYAALAFSPDGKLLAANGPGGRPGSPTTIQLWDTKTGKVARVLESPGGLLRSVAFSPDGLLLAVGCNGGGKAGQVWALSSGQLIHEFSSTSAVVAVAWSPDSKSLAACCSPGVRLWNRDGDSFREVWSQPGPHVGCLAFTPDGKQLLRLSGGQERSAILCDAQTGVERRRFAPAAPGLWRGVVSPDGRFVVVSGGDPRNTFLWRTEDGQLLHRLIGKGQRIAQAVWTADGQGIAWTERLPAKGAEPVFPNSFDLSRLEFGPAVTKDFHGELHSQGPVSLERGPGGSVILVRDGERVGPLKNARYHVGPFTLLSEDRVALAGDQGGSLSLSGIRTDRGGRNLVGHTDRVTALATSPSDRYLLSSADDQLLCIWDTDQDNTLPKGRPLYPLLSLFFAGDDWVAWTQEGYYAGSPGGERMVGWVVNNGPDQLMTFYPAARFRKRLYRPDVIQRLLTEGSVEKALEAARVQPGNVGEPAPPAPAPPSEKVQTTDVEELLPPEARLEVVDRTNLSKGKVKLRATAKARVDSEPVTALRLLVDGRPLPNGQAAENLQDGRPKAEAEWEVELPPGEHELKVLARGPDTAAASAALPVAVPLPVKDRPVLHLIAVGIDAYQQPGLRLQFAAADARALADTFKSSCAGPKNVFGQAQVQTLLDEEASHSAILQALKKVRATVKPGDLVVFSFAGHGVQQGRDFYLLPADADTTKLTETALSGKEVRAALGEMPCQVLLLLDACHAAAAVRDFKPANDEAARELTDDECGVTVLCAAMGREKALEEAGHGLFTHALVEALQRQQDVPHDYRDGRQYVHHLFTFVFDEVRHDSGDRQHPFLNLPWITEPFAIRRLPRSSPGS